MNLSRALAPLPLLLLGCGSHGGSAPAAAPKEASTGEPVVADTTRPAATERVVVDFTDLKSACVFGYRGLVLDLSSPGLSAHLGAKLTPPPVEWVEREGSMWADVRGKTFTVDFLAAPPADAAEDGPPGAVPFVEARIRGGVARSLSFYLNGHSIGSVSVPHGETRVVTLKGVVAQPTSGANQLVVRFTGIPKVQAPSEPSAEIDWVRFGLGESDPTYAAPTRKEAIVSRSFGGEPGRAVSLRGPGFVRCSGWIPAGSTVETTATLEGPGAADVEVRVMRDRAAPTVVGTLHLEAGDAGEPRRHSWPVGDVGPHGTLAAVELSVVRATRGARVLLGQARVVRAERAEPARATVAKAHGVILVIMSDLGAHSLSPYGGALDTPSIARLAATGVVLDPRRSSTGVANGTVAAMLTGVAARDLGVIDRDARLPRPVTTVADAARQAGIASAFFTANPLTSAAYGFDRGWSHFEEHGPTEDGPATRVFEAAALWLSEHGQNPFLVVVHARGGHPPWDIAQERVKTLPPEGYSGGLDPRHAGELLARALRTPGSYRFDDADRARAGALYDAAMEAEDGGLESLLRALDAAGLADTTTVVLTGDVGVDAAARVPFVASEALDESSLETPLIVRWAHMPHQDARAAAPSIDEDIATTVLAALGLPAPVSFRGRDLRDLVAGEEEGAPPRALLAANGERFALRWGPFVTMGAKDREGKLCDLTLEAACVTDVRESYPLASSLLHGVLYDRLVAGPKPLAREPVAPTPALQAELKLWGL